MTRFSIFRQFAYAGAAVAICLSANAFADSHGYVTDGLLVHFDALDNQGDGTFHSDATTWKDIAPGADGTYDLTLSSGITWGEKWLNMNAHSAAAQCGAPLYRTIEIVFRNTASGSRIIFCSGSSNARFVLFDSDSTVLYFQAINENTPAKAMTFNAEQDIQAAAFYDGNPNSSTWTNRITQIYLNGNRATDTYVKNNWGTGVGKMAIGHRSPTEASYKTTRGRMYAIRLYDRVLTDDELAANAEIDRVRFSLNTPAPEDLATKYADVPTAGCVCLATTGRDANSGADWAHPVRNLQTAIDKAGPGGKVLVAAGRYVIPATVNLTNNVSILGVDNGGASKTFFALWQSRLNQNVLAITSSSGSVVSNVAFSTPGGNASMLTNQGPKQPLEMDSGLVTHCAFTNCTTRNAAVSGAAYGGGVHLTGGTVRWCDFYNCRASSSGGGGNRGGGVALEGSNALVENCTIRNCNSTSGSGGHGGGAYVNKGTIRNCLITGCTATGSNGSGIYADNTCTIENCTIVANKGGSSARSTYGLYIASVGVNLRNCVIWGNVNYDGETVKDVYLYSKTLSKLKNNCCATFDIGADYDNITDVPVFTDAANGDYTLGFCTAVDHGLNASWMSNTVDLAGSPRIINNTVDMGCYEREASANLECSITTSLADGLDNVDATLSATVVGDTTGEIDYYWTLTRADGLVEHFVTDSATAVTNLPAGVWDVRLDVTNSASLATSAYLAAELDIRGSAVFVSANGSNTYPYASLADAAHSIDDAFPLLGRGGTMYLDDGVHTITKQIDIASGNGNRIISLNGPDKATVMVANSNTFKSDGYYALKVTTSNAYVEGVTFAGGAKASPDYGCRGLVVVGGSGGTFTNCVFRDAYAYIYNLQDFGFTMTASNMVVDCLFENLTSHGSGALNSAGAALKMSAGYVNRCRFLRCGSTNPGNQSENGDVFAVTGGTIANSLVARCYSPSMPPFKITDAKIINCTFVNNTNSNTQIKSSDNLVRTQGGCMMLFGGAKLYNTIVTDNWSKFANAPSNITVKSQSVIIDHSIVDDVTDVNLRADYTPRMNSPAINAGDWAILGPTTAAVKEMKDLAGNVRLRGGEIDIGCFEFTSKGTLLFMW